MVGSLSVSLANLGNHLQFKMLLHLRHDRVAETKMRYRITHEINK